MITSQQAESKLEGARVDTQREMDTLVKRAKRLSADENISYVEAFLRIQQVSYIYLSTHLFINSFIYLFIFIY